MNEIEVTEEMISAGNLFLMDHYLGDGVYDLRSEILCELFRAMYAARPRKKAPEMKYEVLFGQDEATVHLWADFPLLGSPPALGEILSPPDHILCLDEIEAHLHQILSAHVCFRRHTGSPQSAVIEERLVKLAPNPAESASHQEPEPVSQA